MTDAETAPSPSETTAIVQVYDASRMDDPGHERLADSLLPQSRGKQAVRRAGQVASGVQQLVRYTVVHSIPYAINEKGRQFIATRAPWLNFDLWFDLSSGSTQPLMSVHLALDQGTAYNAAYIAKQVLEAVDHTARHYPRLAPRLSEEQRIRLATAAHNTVVGAVEGVRNGIDSFNQTFGDFIQVDIISPNKLAQVQSGQLNRQALNQPMPERHIDEDPTEHMLNPDGSRVRTPKRTVNAIKDNLRRGMEAVIEHPFLAAAAALGASAVLWCRKTWTRVTVGGAALLCGAIGGLAWWHDRQERKQAEAAASAPPGNPRRSGSGVVIDGDYTLVADSHLGETAAQTGRSTPKAQATDGDRTVSGVSGRGGGPQASAAAGL